MLNICPKCSARVGIDQNAPHIICPACGNRQPFLRLPLLLVGGAAGAGKSAVLQHLLMNRLDADPSYPSPLAALDRVVMLDADLLWREEFNQPEQGYRNFFQTWLRACADISQSGRPVVLFGAGTSVPHNLEPLIERRYFSALHYLALVCQSDELERRIRARDYRPDSDDPNFISEHRDFNRWFIQNAHTTDPPIELIETTYLPLQQVARRVLGWITAIIAQASFRKT